MISIIFKRMHRAESLSPQPAGQPKRQPSLQTLVEVGLVCRVVTAYVGEAGRCGCWWVRKGKGLGRERERGIGMG